MQARRASRELALILFSQFEKEISHYSRNDFENIMLKSVRILSNSASEELKLTVGSLIDIKAMLDDYEAALEDFISNGDFAEAEFEFVVVEEDGEWVIDPDKSDLDEYKKEFAA